MIKTVGFTLNEQTLVLTKEGYMTPRKLGTVIRRIAKKHFDANAPRGSVFKKNVQINFVKRSGYGYYNEISSVTIRYDRTASDGEIAATRRKKERDLKKYKKRAERAREAIAKIEAELEG